MSFSLSVSGHVNGDEDAARIDELVAAKGRELVEELKATGVHITGVRAFFGGPSQSVELNDGSSELNAPTTSDG